MRKPPCASPSAGAEEAVAAAFVLASVGGWAVDRVVPRPQRFCAILSATSDAPRPSNNTRVPTTIHKIVLRGMPGSSGGGASRSSVSLPQWGQSIIVPVFSAGNSMCPPHSRHSPFKYFVRFILKASVASADRKSTRLNSSHQIISYAVFCLKKKKQHVSYRKKALNTDDYDLTFRLYSPALANRLSLTERLPSESELTPSTHPHYNTLRMLRR